MTQVIKLSPPKYPNGIELDYFIELKRIYKSWYRNFISSLESTGFQNIKIDDLFSDFFDSWKEIVIAFKSRIKNIAQRVDVFGFKIFSAQSKKVSGIEPLNFVPGKDKLIDAWVSQNVDLITNMGEESKNAIKNFVIQAQADGISTKKLKEQIINTQGIGEKRAAKIARDQVSKLNGRLTRFRHQSNGIDEYIWQTAGDRRVRPRHRALEGRQFRYGGYSPIGLDPGEDIQCRCNGIPVFPDSYFTDVGLDVPEIEVI